MGEGYTLTPKQEDLIVFISIAAGRLKSKLTKEEFSDMLIDISTEFKNVDIDIIKSAMRKGGLGEFGRTYRFSTQEICIWIREELNVRKNNDVQSRVFF